MADLFDLKEWQQCRDTVGRLDSTLADLRKYGFTLVTGLMTAGALLAGKANDPTLDAPSKAAVTVGLMVLVTALFGIDRPFSVIQSGVVQRAMDIEWDMPPPPAIRPEMKPGATEFYITQRITS